MRAQILKAILYIALLLAVFIAYQPLMEIDANEPLTERGVADPSGFDLSKERARIHSIDWEYYPGHLYAPEDFASGNTIAPVYNVNENPAAFGTYRVTVLLPPGKTYGITGRSFLFSQRTFINGELAGVIGSPDISADATVPRTKMYAYYFTPRTGQTEVVFQVSNFQMKDGGGAYSFSVGEAPLIQSLRLHRQSGAMAEIGCLITVALLFAGMFIFFSRRRYFLWYAMLALMIAVRSLVTGDKPIMEFVQNLNWYAAIRMEYLSLILIVVFAVLYFRRLYPETMPGPVFGVLLGASAVYGLLVLVTKPLFFSMFNPYFALVWVAGGLWVLVRLAWKIRTGGVERLSILLGMLCFMLAAVNDQLHYLFTFYPRFEDSITIGMLLFMYMNMIALFFGFAKTESELAQTRQKAELLAAETEFYHKMSQDLLTPLTVVSTNIQVTGMAPEQAGERLKESQAEIMRMAEMINKALEDSPSGEGSL
ncbi:MAG: hypothetical protein FWC27_08800 [Firmicutes bacterium]|nr:hypothetical protein [Bacillota bacterium]